MQTGCLKQKHFDFDRPKSRLKSYNSLHLNEDISADVYIQFFAQKPLFESWLRRTFLQRIKVSSMGQNLVYRDNISGTSWLATHHAPILKANLLIRKMPLLVNQRDN